MARELIDAAGAGEEGEPGRPRGLRLTADSSRGALVLGVDPREPPARRFLLQFQDTSGKALWTALGPPEAARELLAAVEDVIGRPGELDATSLAGEDASRCGVEAPRVRRIPHFRRPSGAEAAGRVTLRFVVDTAGVPIDSTVRILHTSGPAFTEEVRRGFQKLRYYPGTCWGLLVPVLVRQTILIRDPGLR